MAKKAGTEKRIQKSIQKVDNSYTFTPILERKLQNITDGIRPAFLTAIINRSNPYKGKISLNFWIVSVNLKHPTHCINGLALTTYT
jgi:hypothetical protein